LRIAALPEDSNVIITVEDDGAGIDVQKIKQSAIEKMVITEQEADNMTEQQLINLIFHADFPLRKMQVMFLTIESEWIL